MVKRILLILFFLVIPSDPSAAVKNEYFGEVMVTVEGNNRTKQRYVESLVEKCLEREDYRTLEAIHAGALGQCISNSKLFSTVDVQVNKSVIKVKVAERWTLLPIPNFYTSDGKRSAGVFVFESNFLGYGKGIGVGGSVSTEGDTFTLLYSDPSVNFSNHTLKIIAYRSASELDAYDSTDIIFGYKRTETGLVLAPGYKVTQRLELAVLLNYADRRYEEIAPYAAPGDYSATSAGARVSYGNADYKLFYNDGVSAEVSWLSQVHRSDGNDTVSKTTVKIEWDIAFLQKHALQLGLHAGLQSDNGNAADVMMNGRGKSWRGIEPDGLWTQKIAAASADYHIPVARTGHGTVTVAPFVDYGAYEPFFPGAGSNYAAYGVGAYYFLNRINLPGVGLVAGRNQAFMGTFVAFQVGMGYN